MRYSRGLYLALFISALVAVACSDAPTTPGVRAALDGAGVTQNFFFPATGTFYNVCTDEFVGFGEGAGFHVVSRTTQTADRFHVGFHLNGVNLHGPGYENDGGIPGDPTGTEYHGMLSQNFILNFSPPYPATQTILARTVVNATGDLPNRITYERFHVTVNAQGTVTVLHLEPGQVECRG